MAQILCRTVIMWNDKKMLCWQVYQPTSSEWSPPDSLPASVWENSICIYGKILKYNNHISHSWIFYKAQQDYLWQCCLTSAVEMKNGATGDLIWLWCSPTRQETLPYSRRPSSLWETHSVWIHWLTGLYRNSNTHTLMCDICSPFSIQGPDTCCPCVLPDSRLFLWCISTEVRETCASRQ